MDAFPATKGSAVYSGAISVPHEYFGHAGYDRIAGALKSLDHEVSDQTVGNVLRRHGIEPAPKRGQSTWSGLATYYVLFLIHLESRRITIAGITRHPNQTWMEQMARNVPDESTGCLQDIRYVLHVPGHEVLRLL
jgi:putative transposase